MHHLQTTTEENVFTHQFRQKSGLKIQQTQKKINQRKINQHSHNDPDQPNAPIA